MLNEMANLNSQIPLEKVNNPLETFLEPSDLITPQLPHQLQSLSSNSLDLEAIKLSLENQRQSNNSSNDLLTGQFPRVLADNPPSDNTIATARNINNIGPTLTPYEDSVGTSDDPNDYYRFSLNATSNFTLVLQSDDGDAKVELLASNGTTVIDNEAGDPAVIARSLNSGTYYIRVYTTENAVVEYSLAAGAVTLPFAPDLAGNTSQTARKIGVSSTLTTYKDWVGSTDTNDYYRFSVKNPSGFGLLLNGLSSNANVELLAGDGASVIAKSTKTGTQQDLITLEQLNAGTYYIRVYPGGATETFYNLTVGSLPNLINSPINSFSDDTIATARNITVGSKLTTHVDSVGGIAVGGADSNDYYRFTLNNTSNFALFLRGLSGDADVRLLASDGTTVVASSETGGTISERIVQQLNAGTYYIQVYPFSGSTSYNLSVGAVAVPVGFPDGAGNTTKAAKKINVGTTLITHTDWVNSTDTDYYRFTLGSPSNAGFFLNSLSGDANIEILASDGVTVVDSSTNSGTEPDDIINQFDAGTYFIRVYTNGGEAKYNLTAGAIPVEIEIPDAGGNTIGDATGINFNSSPLNILDEVSSIDRNDYYRFNFSESRGLLLSLSELSADADVRLLKSNGDVIKKSENRGTLNEQIDVEQLSAGTYYIHVVRYSGNTAYRLDISDGGPSIPEIPIFNSIYGYGLIDAAAAVSRAIELSGATPPSFNDVPDLGGYNWGNDLVKAPEVWARGYTGEGIVVAVIDDGVDINHVDLNDDIWLNSDEIAGDGIDNDNNGYIDDIRGWDFFDNDNTVTPTGNDKHGTHVAGTIAADNNGFGATGVAHKAQIMSLKVLDGDSSISQGSLAQAIRYAVDNGAKVINMSLGWPENAPGLQEALQYAADNNVITVTAAGNEQDLAPGSPASYANQYGISVGAIDIDSQLGYFSNRAGLDSDMRHVVAPGVNVYSTVPGNQYQGGWTGTSMASPHVAGVVALMFDANPNLTHAQVRKIIKETSTSLV